MPGQNVGHMCRYDGRDPVACLRASPKVVLTGNIGQFSRGA